MKTLASITLSLFLCAGTAFADSSKDATKDAATPAKPAKPAVAKTSAEIAAEVEELRQTLQAQQKELEAQQEELQLLKEGLPAKRCGCTTAQLLLKIARVGACRSPSHYRSERRHARKTCSTPLAKPEL
jgi:hypothetical protein